MASENVESKVRQIICAQLEVAPEKVTLESSFTEDLKADSLAVMELVLALEEAFGIEIPDEDTEQIKTVRDVISYIESHRKSA
ncbi:MAG: acyl carrier protein [Myxococcales bacterium]|nr:acyl carrier protein [Myxococcota bacterium]MDW8283816.1 acyl carrier protein [Myxococcales bacterium]